MKLLIMTLATFGFGHRGAFLEADKGGASAAIAKAIDAQTDPDKALVAGIKEIGKQQDDLYLKIDQWHGDTKKAAEEFTKAKNEVTGLSADVKAFEQGMAKFRLQMARERGMAYGDPIQRVSQNEELRTMINALVRVGAAKRGLITLGESHTKALSEGSGMGATYLRTELSRTIYDLLPQYGIWGTLAVEPMGTLTQTLPITTADPVAQFIDEVGAFTDDTTIAGTSVNMTAKKIGVILKISRELLQDSEYDVTSQVLRQFLNAIAKRADYAAFMADGTADATNGSATGVWNFGTSVVAATGNVSMETLDLEDFTKVMLGIAVEAHNRMPKWWMHRFILIRCLHVKDLNGRPIFLTALEAPSPGSLGSILGAPVVLGNILPTTNTISSKMMAFGDPQAYVVGVRQDVELASSEHVYFANDQIAQRGVARMGFKGRLATGLGLLTTAAS